MTSRFGGAEGKPTVNMLLTERLQIVQKLCNHEFRKQLQDQNLP